jgi:hypothetical protein
VSANPVVQMFSGVDSVRAADVLRLAIQERRDAWPYVHLYPPPVSQDVNVIGTAATQAHGAAAIAVVTYQVNAGKRFYLQAVLLSAVLDVSASFVPGDALYTVDRNSPIGITDSQFMPEHGLVNIPVQLGSATFGPWRLHRAREFSPLDIVRVKATNVGLQVGAPTYFVCGLFGYEVPVLDVKANR